MQAKVRVAIAWRKHSYPDLTTSYRIINFVEQFVPRLHVLAVQERPEPELTQLVVEQSSHILFCVDPPVVDEHIARRLINFSDLVICSVEDLAGNVFGYK